MFRIVSRTLVLSLALVLISSPAVADKVTVRVGLTTDKGNLQASFGGIINHLQTSDEYSFVVTTYDSYDTLYDAFKGKKVDLALVGAVKYAEAHFETKAVPIIAEGGMTRSMIVVRNDSPIRDVKSLAGKTFAMGYEGSTSTHLMPLLLMSKHRIKETDLGKVEFVGANQDEIVDRVLSGKVDAASIVESVFDRFKDRLRAVETSDPFPGGPLIAHKDADPKLIEAVRKLFLSYKPVPGQRFSGGAIAVTNADFNQIRFLCKVVLGKSYV